jgi:hypothetical protein
MGIYATYRERGHSGAVPPGSDENASTNPACRKAAEADMGQNMTSEAGLTIEAIPA